MRYASILASLLGLAIATPGSVPQVGADDPDTIRRELTAMNTSWSAVRLAYDSGAADALLLPTFYAALRDRRATRAEFITAVATRSPTSKLVRFDNPILTIIKGDSANEWVALVLEKLEYDRTAPDGTVSRAYAMWITRDGYRRVAPGQWRFMYTQEVMRESWTGGRKPPFADWDRRD